MHSGKPSAGEVERGDHPWLWSTSRQSRVQEIMHSNKQTNNYIRNTLWLCSERKAIYDFFGLRKAKVYLLDGDVNPPPLSVIHTHSLIIY